MATANVFTDNKFHFDRSKAHDYEAHYILWNDPQQQIAMMFRYVLLKNPEANDSSVQVWGCFWDKNNPQNDIGLIKRYPLEELSISQDGHCVKMANSGIFDQKSWGDIATDTQQLRWEFEVDSSSCIAIDRFPDVAQYQFFPKFSSPACKSKLSGWVEVNGTRYEINKVNASDGHYSNIQNMVAWQWGNCVNFQEDRDFLFEGISVKFNDWTTPSVWGFYHWDNNKYACNFVDSMFINRDTKSELNCWEFTTQKDGFIFKCGVTARPQEMILLIHPLPDGSHLYTTITLTADMSIDIYDQQTQQKVKTVTADRTATFEVTKPVRNKAVTREFTIV